MSARAVLAATALGLVFGTGLARAQTPPPPDFDCATTADRTAWTAQVVAPLGPGTTSVPLAVELVRDDGGAMAPTCFPVTPDVALRVTFTVDGASGMDAQVRARAWETPDCSGDPAVAASPLSANLCTARLVPEPPFFAGP